MPLVMLMAMIMALTSADRVPSRKVRENRVRRLARRAGYLVKKVDRRDPTASDYGQWIIRDGAGVLLLVADLDATERFLSGEEPMRIIESTDARPGMLLFPREGSGSGPVLVDQVTRTGVLGRVYVFQRREFAPNAQRWPSRFWRVADRATRRAFGLSEVLEVQA